MPALRYWSLARVLLTSGTWFIVTVGGWLYFTVRGGFVGGEGASMAAVSVGINPVMLAIPVLPPIGLIVAWLIMRRTEIPRQGIQLQILEKRAGTWLIASFQNTNSVPEAPFPTGPPR